MSVSQALGRALDAVTETHGFDGAGTIDGPAVHGHGIYILEKGHVRAEFLHLRRHRQKDGNGAQAAHDPADAQRIGDGLTEAVLFGDLEVDNRARFVAAYLEHADGVVGPVQGAAAISGGFDARLRAEKVRDLVGHDLGGAQPHGVDVEEADFRILQLRKAEDVAQQVLGKDCAAGADKGDFWHGKIPFSCCVLRCYVSSCLRAFLCVFIHRKARRHEELQLYSQLSSMTVSNGSRVSGGM